LHFDYEVDFSKEKYDLLNIWKGNKAGTTGDVVKTRIAGHDVVVFRLSHKRYSCDLVV
jgi:hypothetical protein